MIEISKKFPISNEEYQQLHKSYSKLCWKIAHELKRKNSRNNYTEETEDIYQELVVAMLRAGSYFKRQVYIEKCLKLAKEYAKDDFLGWVVEELENLWNDRTRHGANRQKYGPFQEKLLDRIVRKLVPVRLRPHRTEPLNIDAKFGRYCKAIVWNGEKSMGKRISREKSIRNGLVSISEHEHLI